MQTAACTLAPPAFSELSISPVLPVQHGARLCDWQLSIILSIVARCQINEEGSVPVSRRVCVCCVRVFCVYLCPPMQHRDTLCVHRQWRHNGFIGRKWPQPKVGWGDREKKC